MKYFQSLCSTSITYTITYTLAYSLVLEIHSHQKVNFLADSSDAVTENIILHANAY